MLPCFFNNTPRAVAFVGVMNRLIWEYTFVNKMFITAYSLLSNLKKLSVSEFPSEILVFGGAYPLSPN